MKCKNAIQTDSHQDWWQIYGACKRDKKQKYDVMTYVKDLMDVNPEKDSNKNFWFPTPDKPGDKNEHTPIQQRILRELGDLEKKLE